MLEAVVETMELPRGEEALLVVEDDSNVREISERMLSELGYRVYTAADRPEGLDIVKEEPEIRLVITDLVLPGLSGAELCEKIDRMDIGTSVLIISGYDKEREIETALAAECAVGFIPKPFDTSTLTAKVRDALDTHGVAA